MIKIDCCRYRWWIFTLVHVTYLCFHNFGWAVGIMIGLEVVVNTWLSDLFMPYAQPPDYWSIVIDTLLRATTVVVGAILNAFMSYVFDLTNFQGLTGLYFGMIIFLYVWFRLVEIHEPRLWPERTVKDKKRDAERLAKQRHTAWNYSDYMIFGVGTFAFTLMFRDIVVFAEPWTYGMFFAYLVSVVALVAVSDVPGMEWWALLLFFVFWIAVLGIAYAITATALDVERKMSLAAYFS